MSSTLSRCYLVKVINIVKKIILMRVVRKCDMYLNYATVFSVNLLSKYNKCSIL